MRYQRRKTGQTMVGGGLGFGVIFVLFLVLVLGGVADAESNLSQYRSAPVCAESTSSHSGCRWDTTAMVTGTDTSSGRYALVYLTLDHQGGDYKVRFDYPAPRVGADLEVELWGGEVTLINGRQTRDNPARNPNLSQWWIPSLFGVAVAVCLVVAAVGVFNIVKARS